METDAGVTLNLKNNVKYILRGTIARVAADGLAAHQMFNLLSPSALRFCRMCLITREELHDKPHFIGALRTPAQHKKQVKSLIDKTAISKDFGVKGDSIFNESKYFHFTENFSFDCMHDLLEGVCHLVIKLVLSRLIFSEDYDINIDTLNSRISDFNYGYSEQRAKPSPNFTRKMLNNVKSHKIKQKAAQTWCLMRVLPFILSDVLPKGDKYLQIILTVNKILEIVFSPVLPRGTSKYLDFLIYSLEEEFRDLFGFLVDLINKLHHLVHYAECIEQSGPMPQQGCLRYEIMHIKMQRYGKLCCNYINIAYSLAKIVQLSQCSIWGSDKEIIRQKVVFNHSIHKSVEEVDGSVIFLQNGFDKNAKVIITNSVEVYGTAYKLNQFVVLDSGLGTAKNMPIFGEIMEITVINDQVFLYCLRWPAIYLEETLNAYCIEKDSNFSLILTDSLSDCKPFSIWNDYRDCTSYICLRHILC